MILDNHHYYFEEIYKIKDLIWNEESFKSSIVEGNRGVFIMCEDYPIITELRDRIKEIVKVHYSKCYVSLFNKEDHICPFHRDYGAKDQYTVERNLTMINLGDSRTLQYIDKDKNIIKSEELPCGNILQIDEDIHWDWNNKHGIPVKSNAKPRIGITFCNNKDI